MKKQTIGTKELQQTFMLYNEIYLGSVAKPAGYTDILLPDSLEERMDKVIQQQAKPGYFLWNTVGKKAACILVALLFGLTSVTFSVRALRKPVVEFIAKTYRRFTEIVFADSANSNAPESLPHIKPHWPAYIPEGYTVSKETVYILGASRIYTDVQGATFLFSQTHSGGQTDRIDTESAAVKEIAIDGKNGLLSEKDDERILIITDGDYVYKIIGSVTENEMIKIIESIQ